MRKAYLLLIQHTLAFSADLEQIVQLAHSYDIPVLVDEAHGVHIHFHDELPMSAMQAGADMADNECSQVRWIFNAKFYS